MHLADAFIQSDLQCIQAIRFLSVYIFYRYYGSMLPYATIKLLLFVLNGKCSLGSSALGVLCFIESEPIHINVITV